MRIDKLLWFLRLASSRSFAQDWVQAGHIRLNGRRIGKPSAAIAPGDVLTLPMRTRVRVIEIVTLPGRRGPAAEAIACYRVLDDTLAVPLAAGEIEDPA
jgi:ribosome-associated heat shock protein Hsp15